MFNLKKTRVKYILFFLFLFSANVSKAESIGSVNFYIDPSYDIRGENNAKATKQFTGLSAYYFIDDFYWNSLDSQKQNNLINSISALSAEFDNIIYPQMRQFYGEERTPGIDNDKKIYILLSNMAKNTGGYFNPNDEYYKTQVKDGRSNEKEIIYLNINFINDPSVKLFLAHEFQHMINWHQKKSLSGADEEVWLNEALSEYSSALLGYDQPYTGSIAELRINDFLRNSSDSLTEWKNINQDYSSVNLFMQFLADHYGKNILKQIINSKKTGIEAINDALRSLNYKTSFSEIFKDWQIANYLNDKKIFNGKYAYQSAILNYETLHVVPTETFTVQEDKTIKSIEYTKDWSGKWYQLNSSFANNSPNKILKINFSADDATSKFAVPYIIKNIDGTTSFGAISLDSTQSGSAYINDFGTKIDSVVLMPISEKKTRGFIQSESLVKFSYTASILQSGAPIINNINPIASPLEGGLLATITGENFNADSVVKFGDIFAEIQVLNSKTIVAKIPASQKSGTIEVKIINADLQTAAAPQLFSYANPTKDGSLIRAEGDYKVYVVNGNYKRWIQSEKIFAFYNFKWNNVIVVTPETRDYYRPSALIRADGDYKVYEIGPDNKKHHLSMSAAKFESGGRSWDMVFIVNNAEKNFYKTGTLITK